VSLASASIYRPVRARHVLGNGLVVLVMERRHLPTLSATLLFPAGIAAEPEERSGAAFFASQVLPMGTLRRTAVELAEDVDGLGATLSTGCDYDYATIDVTGLSRDADRLLDILAEVTLSPAFLEEEVERRRSQILGLLERRKDDHADVVRNRFIEEIYHGHPYRRTREGTPDTIARMTREDLVDLWFASYVPTGAILAFAGDIDSARAFRLAEERFGGWKALESLPGLPQPPELLPERRIITIQQDVTQAYIRMGNIAIERSSPDFCAAAVMNFILGGAGFGSRLMHSLREERGLTYGVQTNVLTRRQPGYFFASTQTGIATMNEAVLQMLIEIDRFLETGPTDQEIEWAKRFFTGSLPLTLETNDQLAQKMLEQEFYHLEEEYWVRDIERVGAVTAEQVLGFARRHVHPQRFALVVLGDFREAKLDVPPVSGRR
jgi:zinc protease